MHQYLKPVMISFYIFEFHRICWIKKSSDKLL